MATEERGKARRGPTTSLHLAGDAVKVTLKRARRVGGGIAHAIAEVPELVHLRRTARALQTEREDHIRAIGRRVFLLHKKSRGESPFVRYGVIMKELAGLERVEVEYQSTRVRLNEVRDEMAMKRK